MKEDTRVVVSGMGAITSLGNDVDTIWNRIINGENGLGPIEGFDPEETGLSARAAGEVTDFEPDDYEKINQRRHSIETQLTLASTEEALDDADFRPEDDDWVPERVGTSMGVGSGSLEVIDRNIREHENGEIRKPETFFATKYLANMSSGFMNIAYNAQGPNYSHGTACSSSCHSMSHAMREIKRGAADVMLVGGTGAFVGWLGIGMFEALRAYATQEEYPPSEQMRPFDEDRNGFVMGEGAAVFVLESAEHARSRDAEIRAVFSGAGETADAYHPSGPAPDARGLTAAIERALDEADLSSSHIDAVNAHGTATPNGDEHEALALNKTFETVPPVTAPKSQMGHCLGGAGAVEAIIAVKMLEDNLVPPSLNLENKDPECDIPVATELIESEVNHVISNSAGFGGTNGVLVFSDPQDYSW